MVGRRRTPGTEAQRAALRRQQVRLNVQAYRQRNRERKLGESGTDPPNFPSNYRFSRASSTGSESYWESLSLQTSSIQTDVTVRAVKDGTIFSLKLPFKLKLGYASLEAFIKTSSVEPPDNFFLSTLILDQGTDSTMSSFLESSVQLHQLEPETTQTLQVGIRCGGLKTEVCFNSSGTTWMLEEALIALAFNMLSRERRDQKLIMKSIYIENHSLGLLNTGLKNYTQGICLQASNTLLSTAMTMAVSELLINDCEERSRIHLRGVNALINHMRSKNISAQKIL
ncbi:hypothetical protein GcM1_221047 [Golovinomyces cichoracearum]|uniref:Uncharacterized protein n=1 Tax=Golovinomyces cichoracearum TaxID=62708 RepID=A0A420IRS2_9PEZI|nr:hypothetical protein GcM1_221047 [Golovinomyces cichoracearum]